MKKLIQSILISQARSIIKTQKPVIVAVTGSVGKTSTRNAIATALRGHFSVRVPYLNYNNEFGVPLTILGFKSPGKSPVGWLTVLLAGWKISRKSDSTYPRVLILEYGADHAGDIETLCNIAAPDISVITAISPVHLENYTDLDALIGEKATLARRTAANGLVILSADNIEVKGMKAVTQAEVLTFGVSPDADVLATNISVGVRQDDFFESTEQFSEINYHLKTPEGETDVRLPNLLGAGSVQASLVASTVALHLGMELPNIVKNLSELKSEPGRLNPIAGIKCSLIIDDSYNAAPASVALALDTLALFPRTNDARRIAVLGKMAELGALTETEHLNIGRKAAECDVDILLAVGEPARDYIRGAESTGKTIHTEYFANSEDAGRWLDRELKKGDIVLVKGSESSRMEKVVKDIMAEPARAAELLVRQYGKWVERSSGNN